MMKKLYGMSAIVVAVLLLVMVNVYLYHQHYQEMHFSCQGNLIEIYDDYTLSSRISLLYSGDVGALLVEGEVKKKGEYVGTVHRLVDFRVQKKGDDYTGTNYSVTVLPNNTLDESMTKMLFPPYLFSNNVMSKVKILKIADWGYLINREKYIHLYCKK